MNKTTYNINKILLPVRPQIDTCIAIFILVEYGNDFFTISGLEVEIRKESLGTISDKEMWEKGFIAIDTGNGLFDHHDETEKTTATQLVINFLGLEDNMSIQKLKEIAERDDFYGKGTLSNDPLDRAFGLPGLLASLNKTYSSDPSYVVEKIIPLLAAHHHEEKQRTEVLPELVKELENQNKIAKLTVKQRKKNLKVVLVETSLPSMAGFLRSKLGGAFDVVVQIQETGHTNILTRPTKRVDLRSLIYEIRKSELKTNNITKPISNKELSQYGKIDDVDYWFYDTATNSIQNGGVNPQQTKITSLTKKLLVEVLENGLSESHWSPLSRPNSKNIVKKTIVKPKKHGKNDLAQLLAQLDK